MPVKRLLGETRLQHVGEEQHPMILVHGVDGDAEYVASHDPVQQTRRLVEMGLTELWAAELYLEFERRRSDLDLRDIHLDERYVEFRHRPETGTPLKNKRDGEHPVAIQKEVAEVLRRYVNHHRHDVHDEQGRQPLLASTQGRPNTNTIRIWSYQATQPRIYQECPHGKARESCSWTEYTRASKCQSSRSPHRIRTGSLSRQLDRGVPSQVVAERVNATLDVIEKHYDKTEPVERMERRRRKHIETLELNHDSNDANQ